MEGSRRSQEIQAALMVAWSTCSTTASHFSVREYQIRPISSGAVQEPHDMPELRPEKLTPHDVGKIRMGCAAIIA
jgi:hypothetical protein